MRKTLFTTIGGPGSGKSHFTKLLAEQMHFMRLNNDALRGALFDEPTAPENMNNYKVIYGAMDYAARSGLRAGVSVIYDANVNQRSLRDKNARIASDEGADAIVLWIKTPYEVCVNRVTSREVTDEQFRRDEQTVKKHFDLLEEPDEEERFIIVDGTTTADEQLKQFHEQLSALHNDYDTV